jgi:UDP-glucose 4-epimerase
MNVLVTGSSGLLGQALINALAPDRRFQSVVGLDLRATASLPPRVQFVNSDIRDLRADTLRSFGIESVVHTAFVVRPMRDPRLMEDMNVNGTRNVLECADAANVAHVVILSSATVYGFHPDNPVPLSEGNSLRANSAFLYGKHKHDIEQAAAKYFQQPGRPLLTVLRPSFFVDPRRGNPLLAYLRSRLVFLPARTAPLQFTHIHDVVEIIRLMLLTRRGGTYNVGAEGTVTTEQIARKLGTGVIRVPYRLLWILNAIAWKCRVPSSPAPSWAMQLLRYPWIVSSERLKQETGYSFRYSTRAALEDFANTVSQ